MCSSVACGRECCTTLACHKEFLSVRAVSQHSDLHLASYLSTAVVGNC
jgi:hypothetical protein